MNAVVLSAVQPGVLSKALSSCPVDAAGLTELLHDKLLEEDWELREVAVEHVKFLAQREPSAGTDAMLRSVAPCVSSKLSPSVESHCEVRAAAVTAVHHLGAGSHSPMFFELLEAAKLVVALRNVVDAKEHSSVRAAGLALLGQWLRLEAPTQAQQVAASVVSLQELGPAWMQSLGADGDWQVKLRAMELAGVIVASNNRDVQASAKLLDCEAMLKAGIKDYDRVVRKSSAEGLLGALASVITLSDEEKASLEVLVVDCEPVIQVHEDTIGLLDSGSAQDVLECY